MCSLIHWDYSWHMFLSPFLRSNGFPVILWAALERTRRVVMYALFCMSLCCISIKRLKILLEGTDGLQLSWNESNASQFMSMKRRYVGMQNALSMVSVRWRTASRMEVDKLSVGPTSLITQHQYQEKPIPFDMSTQKLESHMFRKTGAWHASAMCYSLNYYLASDSFHSSWCLWMNYFLGMTSFNHIPPPSL